MESPSYDRAITLLRRAGAKVVGIPLEPDGVNLTVLEEELEQGAPTLMYIIADFQNPMGVTTSLEKRRRLTALAEEYGFWIVEDAPYRKLRYWGEDVPSLRSLSPERVLYMSSFSKVLSPGLRLGYVVGTDDIIASFSQWALDSYIGPVLPTQGMVYEYCRRGLLEPNIEHLKQVYRPRLEAILSALDKRIPQAAWTRPEGGFFVSGFGIVSFGSKMTRDRFTLFQRLCFRWSAKGPQKGFQRVKMAAYVHLGLRSAQKV